ncbi:UTP--glucose-1-phosphate uridylyltransferase [Desulfosarcina widdelii]|uniref:UTP--glucose-1-phosphate uridylyltransferase n=1 Tax=Desulfosarcina widdelii TaxID=947919 RepID=A0A5K7Z8M1_9BACT|nr:UTP--glucose-1-phosphate uridylyltransferase [Desulfosarcina widdelii]BBO78186.1 UTP--glucose-1-phosphate uridylyltransferase [Desulfosarcina widdelii]
MGRRDKGFEPLFRKMQDENLPQLVIDHFKHYYDQLVAGQTGNLPETEIEPIETLPEMEKLGTDQRVAAGERAMHRAAIIKLNGGLGTSMGMQKAKSLLQVKNGLSFLDIIVRQALALDAEPPVIFMNSFSTQDDTRKALSGYSHLKRQPVPLDFLQHKIPKVSARDLGPMHHADNPHLEWCPPGHGDLYPALLSSGMLDRLLKAGYAYAFVSNADNLGAVLDPAILGYFVESGLSFMMEAADRTDADKKGGHLARMKSGGLVLREIAQTPEADVRTFQDIRRHKFFNTNNVWIHLPALKKILARKKGILGLPMIRNRKTLDPRDPDSLPVYQLETAVGAAISVFDKVGAIRVPRRRFIPVKSTNDLLALRSDHYVLTSRYRLVPNPKRKTDRRVQIRLDPAYYKSIDQFEYRFPCGAPSLLECESLTIDGDIRFGNDVRLKGGVELLNENDGTYDMEPHRSLEGTLRV